MKLWLIFLSFGLSTVFADSLVSGGNINQIRLANGDFAMTVENFSSCNATCLNAGNNKCYISFNKNDGSIDIDDYKVFVSMSISAYAVGHTLYNADGNATTCKANYIVFQK